MCTQHGPLVGGSGTKELSFSWRMEPFRKDEAKQGHSELDYE